MENKIIMITGGSGAIGTAVTRLLVQNGFEVRHYSRKNYVSAMAKIYKWNPNENYIDPEGLKNVHGVIHLAGSSIADKRWTKAYKEEILQSRIKTAQLLKQCIHSLEIKPQVFISASGIGIYKKVPHEHILHEDSAYGTHFLAEVCKQWEKETHEITKMGIRGCIFRIGIVLDKQHGALPTIQKLIQYGIGAPLGSGTQWMPWIHIDDLARMFLYAITHTHIQGVYNACAPKPVTNADFTKILAEKLKVPIWLPNVPAWVLQWVLGEMSGLILEGNNISSQKIQEAGFTFNFDTLEKAFQNLYEK